MPVLHRSAPRCRRCDADAPYGDQRIAWICWHEGLTHRLWWSIKRRLGGAA